MAKTKFSKDVEKTRTIPFVFSNETRDSYGTVFTAAGWDLTRFANNPIALYNHESWGSDPDMAIGSARAWVEGSELLGEITFESAELNPVAEKVFRKYLAGTFRGVSIRFFPLERGAWGKGEEDRDGANPTYYFGKRELVEISCVPIPSNKNATVRSIGNEFDGEPVPDTSGFFVDGCVRSIEQEEQEETGDQEVPADEREMDTTDTQEQSDEYLRVMADALHALSV